VIVSAYITTKFPTASFAFMRY